LGIAYNTSVVRNGLMLHLDAANVKSYNPNLLAQGQIFNNGYWNVNGSLVFNSTTELAPNLTQTATKITDDSSTNYEFLSRSITIPNNTQPYTFSIYVKKTSGGTAPGFAINSSLSGGTTVNSNQRLNTDTGAVTSANVISEGDYWRMYWTLTNNNTGNTSLNISIYPAARLPGTTTDTPTATGSATIWGMSVTRGNQLLPYIPTLGTSGNIWYDLTGNGRNGTLINGPIFSDDKSGSLIFDGIDDHVIGSNNLGFSGDPEMTISYWAIWTGTSFSANFPSGFGNNSTATPNRGLSTTWSGGRIALDFWNNRFRATTALNVNTWYNVAFTKVPGLIGSTVKLYANSQELSGSVENSNVTPDIIDQPFVVGRLDSTRNFTGNISNIQIYNRALTASEISQNFNALRGRYGI
jgi:archaellum component FlaG (FlaF/FlaG flagellin family)